MRLGAAIVVALIIVGGAYWGWIFVQSHSTLPKQLLDQYMPLRIDTDALTVEHYDSSFIASIDGGIESRLWRIILGGEDSAGSRLLRQAAIVVTSRRRYR